MNLRVTDVHKSFRDRNRTVEVLRGVTLEASPGDTIAIIGQSGSGKSTLLSLLAGLDRPTSGTLEVGDHELSTMNEAELAAWRGKSLGIVFQQYHLMHDLTALENVSLPLELFEKESSVQRAQAALISVGLQHRESHYPRELSGGESQRVAIARAIVTSPAILLADEPTGNLDFETSEQIADVLFDVVSKANAIFILVTHSEELAARCQTRYHLHHGMLQQ